MLFPSESAVDCSALIVLLMAAASASGARVLSGISVDGVTNMAIRSLGSRLPLVQYLPIR